MWSLNTGLISNEQNLLIAEKRHSSQQKENNKSRKDFKRAETGCFDFGVTRKHLGWQSFWEKFKSARHYGRILDLDFPYARDTSLGKPLNSPNLSLLICQCVL